MYPHAPTYPVATFVIPMLSCVCTHCKFASHTYKGWVGVSVCAEGQDDSAINIGALVIPFC